MLDKDNACLVVIDVQEKLAPLMHGREALFTNLQKMIRGARALALPILWLEQNPAGLGPTIPEVGSLMPDIRPIPKHCFSCWGESAFVDALEACGRRQVLVVGIETHVCVYQTVADLLRSKYEVHVVSEGVSSRTAENRQLGLNRCCALGASITGVEMALFEMLKEAKGDRFKEILKIVR